jgi:dienelactone hydrolase
MTIQNHRRQLLTGAMGATVAAIIAQTRAQAQGAAPASPTPPKPALEVFARTPLIDNIALSPDGKRVAAITQAGDKKVMIHFDVADTNNPKTTLIGPSKVRDIFWGDNKHVILVTSETVTYPEFSKSRAEVRVANAVDVDNATVKTFFSKQNAENTGTLIGGKRGWFYPIVIGRLTRIKVNGQYRVTAASYRMIDDYNLCLFSFGFDSAIGKPVIDFSRDTEDFIVTPDGQIAGYSAYDTERKEWRLLYNTGMSKGTQSLTTIYKTKGEVINRPDLWGLGRDGNSLVISLPIDEKGNVQFHEISASGELSAPFEHKGESGQHFPLFHPVTKVLVGFGHHEDTLVYDYFDPLLKKLYESTPKVLGEGYRNYPAGFAEDPRQMLVYSEGADDAGSYYFIDFTTGNGIQVGSNYPDLPPEWIAQRQAIEYKAADGLTIHGYLTLPPFKTAKNLPLVVLPHGGPESRDYIDHDWQSQALAAQGYAVLQPNFRGSSGYGGGFVTAGYGEWGRKMQTDLSDGVRYLTAKGIVDPKRVAIFGASYGGYAAMAGATLDAGVYNCAVAIAGVSDLKLMVDWEQNNSGDSRSTNVVYWKQFMGDPKGWDDVSPAKQASKAYCPLLLIHGTDDTVVPIDQSRRMEQALKAAGKPVEFVTYKGQDHWETIESTRIDMMKQAIAFLGKYNPA